MKYSFDIEIDYKTESASVKFLNHNDIKKRIKTPVDIADFFLHLQGLKLWCEDNIEKTSELLYELKGMEDEV